MRKYNLTVFRISKTHWMQDEQKILDSREMLLYAGHVEVNALYTQEYALMLSREARKALLG